MCCPHFHNNILNPHPLRFCVVSGAGAGGVGIGIGVDLELIHVCNVQMYEIKIQPCLLHITQYPPIYLHVFEWISNKNSRIRIIHGKSLELFLD